MMVNLGAAVNVIHGIRTHHAQTTGCPTWDEAGIRAATEPSDTLQPHATTTAWMRADR